MTNSDMFLIRVYLIFKFAIVYMHDFWTIYYALYIRKIIFKFVPQVYMISIWSNFSQHPCITCQNLKLWRTTEDKSTVVSKFMRKIL
jgi:hypothetical protein